MIRKHIIFIFFFSLQAFCTFSQQVLINGVDSNRNLVWSDFIGQPEESSPFIAYTWWHLSYSYSGVEFKGDTALLQGLVIKLELVGDKCWIKRGYKSNYVLAHEQGHFDIGRLCALELAQTMDTTTFFQSDFQTKHQLIFNSIFQKYNALGMAYDVETDHSIDRHAQKKWNRFIDSEFQRLEGDSGTSFNPR